MKKATPYTFIPQVEGANNTWSLDSETVHPKKIAMLYNRGTASAGEGMIQYFMQSDKVITIGENSGGYIGYGNVMSAVVPCEKFTVQSTTTRYLQKSKYEFLGIEPKYKVKKSEDWIRFAEKMLSRER
jgi:C-terminal processing protease CtpA/Prc